MRSLTLLVASLVVGAMASSALAEDEVLFQGFYRLETNAAHRGFAVLRRVRDKNTGDHTVMHYIFRRDGEGIHQAGVHSTATKEWKPLAYSYFVWQGRDLHSYVGEFRRNDQLVVRRYEEMPEFDDEIGRRYRGKLTKVVPGDVVTMTLMTKVMAATSGNEWRPGFRKTISVLSEDRANVSEVDLRIHQEQVVKGMPVYQIVGELMNEHFELMTLANGEIVGSRNKANASFTLLVANSDEAYGKLEIDERSLTRIFGNVPRGATMFESTKIRATKIDFKKVLADFGDDVVELVRPDGAKTR